jgi:ketosteroid isomerase-like protein
MRNASPTVSGALALTLAVASLAATPAAPGKPNTDATAVASNTALANDALMIAHVRDQWLAAVNAADLHGILAAYAPGAVVLPDALPPFLGAASIGTWHERWLPLADVNYSLEATLLYVDGDRALEEWAADVTIAPRGDTLLGVDDDPLQFRQGGVRVYRKDSRGRWRIDRETWSPDHPAVQRLRSSRPGVCAPRLC